MKATTTEIRQDQLHDWEFRVELDGQPQDSLRVIQFDWREKLSKCYKGQLILASKDAHIDIEDCLDRNLLLSIHHKYDEQTRYLTGIVEDMDDAGFAGDWAKYKFRIRPELHRLSLTSDARIFQHISVPDIVATLLKEQGIVRHEFRLNDNRPPREYCVMYDVDHLTFIEHLLAEEGIFYFWEHSEAGAKLIFVDQSVFGTLLTDSKLEYNNSPSGAVKGQFIHKLSWRESIRSTDLKQRDYCFKNPRYSQEHDLFQQREGGEAQTYTRYNPYGGYKDDDSGKRFTRYQLESVRNDASSGKGGSNAMHFNAGHRFFVSKHPYKTLNREYMIVGVKHSGEQPQALEAYEDNKGTFYRNQFKLHAVWVYSWRPKQPPKPKMYGLQMAHVVGPKGEEIYCDEHGRVKIQFPWDLRGENDEHSSCWIRVSQGWAGAGWGGMAIPRIGQEVIVDFLEGDPDQPIIIGRTYHAVNTPPYALPANKTRMSIKSQTHKGEGFNELRFEDENGRQEVFIHAQKDQNNIVRQNETTQVGNNRGEIVGQNDILQVGSNRQEQIGGAQETVVNKDINVISQSGNINLQTAGASLTLTTDGQIYINGKQVTVIGTQDIQLNPDGASGRPALQPLNLDMQMPKVPGTLKASPRITGTIEPVDTKTNAMMSLQEKGHMINDIIKGWLREGTDQAMAAGKQLNRTLQSYDEDPKRLWKDLTTLTGSAASGAADNLNEVMYEWSYGKLGDKAQYQASSAKEMEAFDNLLNGAEGKLKQIKAASASEDYHALGGELFAPSTVALMALGTRGVGGRMAGVKNVPKTTSLNPNDIRFSQNTVSYNREI